ncbi:MAG: hypothetical protein ABEN55_21075 [Bradymonadaceae bacterium]
MKYEYEEKGYTNPQFLQGASTRHASFIEADDAIYGVGATPFEAFENALNVLGQRGYDVEDVANPFEDVPPDPPEEAKEAFEEGHVNCYIAFYAEREEGVDT